MKYIGVKMVDAVPMNSVAAHKNGYRVDNDQVNAVDGYEITYPDGYKSWCPKSVFDEHNRPVTGMPFGYAIEAARMGLKVARAGWNGKGMFVVMQPELKLPPFNTQGTERKVNDRTARFIGEDKPLNCVPYFAMKDADDTWVPGWLASQTDMLADDWTIVE